MPKNNWHNPPPLPNLVQQPPGYMPLNSEGMTLANLAAWHQTRIGDMGYLAAQPEGAVSQPLGMPSNPAAVQRRVWKDEPPGSIPFDQQDEADLTGVAGTTTTVLTLVVPAGYDGVIKWLSNNIINATFVFGTLTWGLFINNRPVRNFGTIALEKGTIAQGREISPIRIFANDVVEYRVNEILGGLTGMTVVSLTGYFYPSKGVS
jgi:hypothetical protein